MSQKESLLELFQVHANRLTLGQILKSPIGYEWRARATELRRDGYRIDLERGEKPSDNTYHLLPPVKNGDLV